MNASQYRDIRCVLRRLDGLRSAPPILRNLGAFCWTPPILRVMKDRRVCRMGEVKRNPSEARWNSADDGLPRAPSGLRDFDGFRWAPPILRDFDGLRLAPLILRNLAGFRFASPILRYGRVA